MYSQDETVNAVQNFYLELTKLTYPDESWLRVPPPEGWSAEEMVQAYEELSGKTPVVKQLLKHLPYLRTDSYGRSNMFSDILLTYYTYAISYAVPKGTFVSTLSSGEQMYPLPAHCVYLTHGDNEATNLVLDTERGTVTATQIFQTGLSTYTVPRDEYDRLPYEEKWRAFPTLPVQEFFENWTRYYRNLVWMLTPVAKREGMPHDGRYHSRGGMPREQQRLAEDERDLQEWNPDVSSMHEDQAWYLSQTATVYNTHLRHGWPSHFNKAECKRALIELERRADEDFKRRMDEISREAGDI